MSEWGGGAEEDAGISRREAEVDQISNRTSEVMLDTCPELMQDPLGIVLSMEVNSAMSVEKP